MLSVAPLAGFAVSMTCFSHSLVGLIEVESSAFRSDAPTLEAWFAGMAGATGSGEKCAPRLFCARGRLSRTGSSMIDADLGQLVADLDAEYERLLDR